MERQRLTTVTVPAGSYDLVTLDDVKLEFNIDSGDTSKDTWLAKAITRSSKAVANYCNRVFPAETLEDTIYLPRDDGWPKTLYRSSKVIQLSRWPIISMASVTIEEPTPLSLVEGTDFRTDDDAGQLIRLHSSTGLPKGWATWPIVAVYEAGFAEIPDDVQDATIRLVKKAWWQRGTSPQLKAREQDGSREEFWVSNGNDGNMTPDIQDLLSNYRVPVTA